MAGSGSTINWVSPCVTINITDLALQFWGKYYYDHFTDEEMWPKITQPLSINPGLKLSSFWLQMPHMTMLGVYQECHDVSKTSQFTDMYH